MFTTALSADFNIGCDYAFLWLNKSRHASSSVKICILVIAALRSKKSVHVATGKQVEEKHVQVCNESMKHCSIQVNAECVARLNGAESEFQC